MRSKTLFSVVFLLVLVSLVAAACTPAPATQPPVVDQPTEVVAEPTAEATMAPEEPTTEPMAFEGMVQTAPDCDYGGLIKEIASLDELTVQFTMCVPDPAFPSKAAFSAFSMQPREWIEAAMVSREILEKPIGTGPYS